MRPRFVTAVTKERLDRTYYMSNTAAIRQFLKGSHHRNFDPSTRQGDMVTVFDVEKCDVCKGEILAANPMTIGARDGQLRFVGLIERPMPEEGGHCEALGLTTCMSCYVTDQDDQTVLNAKVW